LEINKEEEEDIKMLGAKFNETQDFSSSKQIEIDSIAKRKMPMTTSSTDEWR
jgi:hypothetical protein